MSRMPPESQSHQPTTALENIRYSKRVYQEVHTRKITDTSTPGIEEYKANDHYQIIIVPYRNQTPGRLSLLSDPHMSYVCQYIPITIMLSILSS